MYAILLCVFAVIVSILCVMIMKKIQPDNFKLYLVYVIVINLLLYLFIGFLYTQGR